MLLARLLGPPQLWLGRSYLAWCCWPLNIAAASYTSTLGAVQTVPTAERASRRHQRSHLSRPASPSAVDLLRPRLVAAASVPRPRPERVHTERLQPPWRDYAGDAVHVQQPRLHLW